MQTGANTLQFGTGATPNSSSGTGRWYYNAGGIYPTYDNAMALGGSSNRWSILNTVLLNASGTATINNGVANGQGVVLNLQGSGDVLLASGGAIFFGDYNYNNGTHIQGSSAGDWIVKRAGSEKFRATSAGLSVTGTITLPNSNTLTGAGNDVVLFSKGIETTTSAVIGSVLYLRSSVSILNGDGTGWHTFLSRATSGANASVHLHRVRGIAFDYTGGYDDYTNHGIASTNTAGAFSDNLSINSFNDVNVRLDTNNNNATSYFRIYDNTATDSGGTIFSISSGGNAVLTGTMNTMRVNQSYDPQNGDVTRSSLGSRFYMTFVSNKTDYPSSYGHLLGTWDANGASGNTPQYAYQIFKPYTADGLRYREGRAGNVWSNWFTFLTTDNINTIGNLNLSGQLVAYSSFVNYTYFQKPGTTSPDYWKSYYHTDKTLKFELWDDGEQSPTNTITFPTTTGTIALVGHSHSTLTRGSYLTGSNYDGTSATTWAVDATTTATANKIVARDAYGYIFGVHFNQSSGNGENPTISQVIVTNGSDGYFRKASIAHLTSAVLTGTSPSFASITASDVVKLANNKALQGLSNDSNYYSLVAVGTDGAGLHYGYRGRLLANGVNGLTYIYGGDASNSISLVIAPSRVTFGTADGTGSKPIYLNGIYNGTTQVMDSSRNLLAINDATAAEYYTSGWFRNNDSGDGLYNTATTTHWYSDSHGYWNAAGNGATAQGIRFRASYAGTIKGYLYWDGSGIGLLNDQGGWSIRANQGSSYGGDLNGTWNIDGILNRKGDNNFLIQRNGSTKITIQSGTTQFDTNVSVYGTSLALLSTTGLTRIESYVGDNSQVGLRVRRGGSTSPSDWELYIPTSSTEFRFYNGADKMSLTTGGNLTVTGNVTGYGTISDAQMKENVLPLHNAISVMKKLRPVSFEWNTHERSMAFVGIHNDYGFIAQEVEGIIPNVVREDSHGYKSLRYQSLIPYSIQAIKELVEKVETLEKKIEELEGGHIVP